MALPFGYSYHSYNIEAKWFVMQVSYKILSFVAVEFSNARSVGHLVLDYIRDIGKEKDACINVVR